MLQDTNVSIREDYLLQKLWHGSTKTEESYTSYIVTHKMLWRDALVNMIRKAIIKAEWLQYYLQNRCRKVLKKVYQARRGVCLLKMGGQQTETIFNKAISFNSCGENMQMSVMMKSPLGEFSSLYKRLLSLQTWQEYY